jgi:hypothetical protein
MGHVIAVNLKPRNGRRADMGGIFISYRREDSGPYAGRLRDALSHHFGAEQVFRDIDTINPGERFPRIVEREVSSCHALLAVIGPMWLAVRDEAARRRLDNPDDYVRLEIATALGRGDDVLVIPVLVGRTSMPAAADLPKPLASLGECNAVRITDESWDDQVARLIRALEKVVRRPVVPSPHLVTAPEAGVSTAIGMGAGPARPIAHWLWRKARPDISRGALIGYADNLAEAISRRETVLLDQMRGGPDTVMDLRFQLGPRVRSAGGADIGVLSNIAPYFRQQASPRRLLVVGEAGAGKTVLAVHLLLDQLRDRAALTDNLRIETLVPVRVNVAGWDGGGDFTSWMASRLGTDYGLPPKVALALTDAGYILPILDGLDEMDPPNAEPERARIALDRLNEPPWRNRAVVVMCRSSVYDRIRELRGDAGLHGATTITLQPLSPIEIRDYLEHYRGQLGITKEAWAPVTDQIGHNPDGPLATALRTPWLLGLAATALHRDRHTATQLAACGDTADIRDRLFAALIPAAVHGTRRTGPTRDYTEQNVQTWMHTLAQHLERRRTEGMGGTEITLGEVWALAGTRRCPAVHALAVGVAVALVGGLVGGIQSGLASGLVGGLTFGLLFGLAAGLMPGLPVGLAANTTAPKRFAGRVPGRSRWRRGLLVGTVAGLAVAAAVGLVAGLAFAVTEGRTAGLMYGLMGGLIFGLLYGLMLGVPFGLLVGLAAVLTANISAPKRFAWRVPGRSRWRRGLLVGTAVGLVVGLTDGLIFGITDGLVYGITDGLLTGLAVGLLFGFMTGLRTTADDRLALGQDARQVIRDDLVAALTVGVMSGLLFGLVQVHTAGLLVSLASGLASGLIVGLLVGLTAGRHATASLLFALTETFPARPVQFLEWARNAGLLRVTGIAYQCRHDSYQQWLAAGGVDRGVKTTFDAQAS